ncbi:MAG: 50S ribosomal protein L17 [bacterium]
MKKRKSGKKFSREKDQRRALLKTLAGSLILKEKIVTTEAKAKEVARFTEKIITHAVRYTKGENLTPLLKQKNLSKRRLLARFVSSRINKKLEEEIGPRYQDRPGGYTRVIKMGPRKSDGARMAVIELVK